jgi:hypothetical protein
VDGDYLWNIDAKTSHMDKLSEKKARIFRGGTKERHEIYRMRHDVYAQELGQHLVGHERTLREPLE